MCRSASSGAIKPPGNGDGMALGLMGLSCNSYLPHRGFHVKVAPHVDVADKGGAIVDEGVPVAPADTGRRDALEEGKQLVKHTSALCIR